ncbi:MAG: UDP-N-acetylmuramate dehydrogenase, partial [Candidatus Omnitrophica bacterium]|nr:UDP-N-acetylmuramate dehydrogenase [Candidatus Omnitrophota bacterium]
MNPIAIPPLFLKEGVRGSSKIPLAQFTTFQLGGPCRYLVECATPDALQSTVRQLAQENTPFLLIGGGSNLVISGAGLDVAVIRYVSSTPLIEREGNDVRVAASTELDALALFTVEEGLEGLVYTCGIPGTVGGAVAGNAGAWGKQVGDVLKSALILDKQGNTKTVGPEYFAFSYRHSRLKETDDIVMEATFALKPGDPIALAHERAQILRIRAEKHPNLSTHPCAGSFFRNVGATSKAGQRQAAGWFLEQAGGKSLSSGGAHIFNKHANIIIKGPHCTAQDVYDLHLKMIELVKNKFGFLLNREVRFAGKF